MKFTPPPRFIRCCALLMMSFNGGCYTSSGSTTLFDSEGLSSAPVHSEVTVVNAGVVLGDKESYLCIPVSSFQQNSVDVAVSAKSSCDCIRPELIKYKSSSGGMEDGLMVTFLKEQDVLSDAQFRPASLGVGIVVEFRSGKERTVRIDFLSTKRLEAVQ